MFLGHRDRKSPNKSQLVRAPRVDYEDYRTFVELYEKMHKEYSAMIENAVIIRQTPASSRTMSQNWPFFSQRDLLLVGLAEFPDLRKLGLMCALKLTRNRGLRFCYFLNDSVVEAVTTACRTYINTLSGLRLMHEGVTVDVDYSMMTGLMVDSMFRVSGQCETFSGFIGTNLFDANFMQWETENKIVNMPRHMLKECMLALAMLTHVRLGHCYSIHLSQDTLQPIYRLLCG